MASVLRFLQNSQINHKNYSNVPLLDCGFLFDKFVCQKSDVYAYDGQDAPPFVCKFKKDTMHDIAAVAMEEGDISLLNTASSTNLLFKTWKAHENAIFDICWIPDKPALITASGDYSSTIWDVSSGKMTAKFASHLGSVKCVDVCTRQPAVFATGARDGKVCVWDSRVNTRFPLHVKSEIIINDAHNPSSGGENRKQKFSKWDNAKLRSVTSVLFQDEHNLLSAGVGDQNVKVWDLRRTYVTKQKGNKGTWPKHMLYYGGNGCTSLAFDSTYKHLYACCTNSVIYKYDCHSYNSESISSYNGCKVATYFVKLALSPDDQYLLCGSSDENAYIWRVSNSGKPICKLTGHSAEVTGVSWHTKDISTLVTCSDDNRTFIWKITGIKDMLDKDDIIGSAISNPCNEPFIESSIESDSDKVISATSSPRSSFRIYISTLNAFFTKVPSPSTSSVGHSLSTMQSSSANNDIVPSVSLEKGKSSEVDPLSRPILSPNKILNNENINNGDRTPKSSPNLTVVASGSSSNSGVVSKNKPVTSPVRLHRNLFTSPNSAKSVKRPRYSPKQKKSSKVKPKPSERLITSYFQECA